MLQKKFSFILFNISSQETETEKSIALVKGLENNVNRKKGKGIKSRSCIKVVKVYSFKQYFGRLICNSLNR